jgi:hypothetical protein
MEALMNQHAAEELVKAIAAETHAPMETVSRMYEETWAAFSDGARIMDYLTVLVARRVRENLRSLRQDAH